MFMIIKVANILVFLLTVNYVKEKNEDMMRI